MVALEREHDDTAPPMSLHRLLEAPLGAAAIAVGLVAAALIIGFLVRKPELTPGRKLLLGIALFVLPTLTALLGNVHNMATTKRVEFCGSCHVMTSYVEDVHDKKSESLASLHGRLPSFHDEACYQCHSDYGMYGGVTTKIGGMHHVIAFYGDDWTTPNHRPPKLYKPYDMRRCLECHDPLRSGAPLQHRVHADKIEQQAISCSAAGCHGPPHPPWVQAQVSQ